MNEGNKTILEEVGQIASEVASAIYDFVGGAIQAYADVEQYEGGLEKLFGEDAITVIQNANDALFTANLAAGDYMSSALSISAALISSFEEAGESAEDTATSIFDTQDNLSNFGNALDDVNDSLNRFSSFTTGGMSEELNSTALAADAVDVAMRAAADNAAALGTDLDTVVNT